ncbi:MAG: hypothetical protein K6U80_16880 [Firmicutes bacterium]|nr:hypothetical protein [Bacillota bacterium]
MKTKPGVLKNIIAVCLSFAILFPVSLYFGMVKPSFIIAFTGLALKFTGGGMISGSPVRNESPVRYAVAGVFAVTGISFLSVLVPITVIPLIILVLALMGVLVLLDYKTPPQYLWYSRPVIVFILFICLLKPRAWGVNELFYGAFLQASGLPDWMSRMMGWANEILKLCGLKDCKE